MFVSTHCLVYFFLNFRTTFTPCFLSTHQLFYCFVKQRFSLLEVSVNFCEHLVKSMVYLSLSAHQLLHLRALNTARQQLHLRVMNYELRSTQTGDMTNVSA